MLAYVYGVVPISLCRGGGCGVSRGKGRGVRIDFDEDDGPITGDDAQRTVNCFLCLGSSLNVIVFSRSLILQWQMRGELLSLRASVKAAWTGQSAA